jgi:penicillin-binding protein 2
MSDCETHALFMAYAPAKQPKIAVAVLVENAGLGGSIAAPIARKVFDAWLLRDQKTGPAALGNVPSPRGAR